MKKKVIYIVMAIVLLIAIAATAAIYISKNSAGEKKEAVQTAAAGRNAAEKMMNIYKMQDKTDLKMEQETVKEKNITIAIDPGHQGSHVDMSAQEENAPGSGIMKQKATSGTTGSYTGLPEYQLNLDISLKLRDKLEALGYSVVMAREDNDTAISNKERAQLANESGADICVRIHANGSENPASQGALCLITSQDNPHTGDLYAESYRLADAVLATYCEATGFANQGIQTNDTMTGINWSEIPVIILEMGFMTNEHDDTKMADAAFQEKMADSIAEGIENYYAAGN